MDPQQVLTIGRDGLLTLLTVAGPIVLVVLAVGLVVSIFQAATQISEQTLSFVPKLLAAFATLAVAGPWMINTLVEYIQQVLQSIPTWWAEARIQPPWSASPKPKCSPGSPPGCGPSCACWPCSPRHRCCP